MLTLEQAIEHCHEKAEELRKQATIGLDSMTDTVRVEECRECANEHEQLAEWLTELKALREFVYKPRCESCIHWDDTFNCGTCNSDYDKFEFNKNLFVKENDNG